MPCDPWPGVYPNPLDYEGECGHVHLTTARGFGWSCEYWAAVHDAACENTLEECPPISLEFLASLPQTPLVLRLVERARARLAS